MLLTEKSWIGEFFVPDDYHNRFLGKIDYSPEEGVVLSWHVASDKLPRKSNVIHGVLDTGEKCALIYPLYESDLSMKSKQGLHTRHGKTRFSFLLIGDFIAENELFYEVCFSITNLQEFFFPKGWKDQVKYSDGPLLSISSSLGEIEVGNSAPFGFLSNDITSHIYAKNKDALKELDDEFKLISTKYQDPVFVFKKDISYLFRIKVKEGDVVNAIHDYVKNISGLFALLVYHPVFPEYIYVTKRNGNPPVQIDLFPTVIRNKKTLELSVRELSHFNMPITNDKVELAPILINWLDKPELYSTIVASLQNETGFRDEHSLHGELVLYAAQLEMITHKESPKCNEKYKYPIDKYASTDLKNRLQSVLAQVGSNNIGEVIADIRNEIAHVGRPKKLLSVLSMLDLIEISSCLHMTVMGYILSELGINKDIIAEYQRVF